MSDPLMVHLHPALVPAFREWVQSQNIPLAGPFTADGDSEPWWETKCEPCPCYRCGQCPCDCEGEHTCPCPENLALLERMREAGS